MLDRPGGRPSSKPTDPGGSHGTENGTARRNGSPRRCRFGKSILKMVGESIMQILLLASIVFCTLGSAVPVYGCIHPGKSSSRPVERNEPHRCAREAR